MLMRPIARVVPSLLLCLVSSGCSLVIVPVETVGSIAAAAVTTAGEVATAPFRAMSRHPPAAEQVQPQPYQEQQGPLSGQ